MHAVPLLLQFGVYVKDSSMSREMSFSILVAAVLIHCACRQPVMEVVGMVSDQEPCDVVLYVNWTLMACYLYISIYACTDPVLGRGFGVR